MRILRDLLGVASILALQTLASSQDPTNNAPAAFPSVGRRNRFVVFNEASFSAPVQDTSGGLQSLPGVLPPKTNNTFKWTLQSNVSPQTLFVQSSGDKKVLLIYNYPDSNPKGLSPPVSSSSSASPTGSGRDRRRHDGNPRGRGGNQQNRSNQQFVEVKENQAIFSSENLSGLLVGTYYIRMRWKDTSTQQEMDSFSQLFQYQVLPLEAGKTGGTALSTDPVDDEGPAKADSNPDGETGSSGTTGTSGRPGPTATSVGTAGPDDSGDRGIPASASGGSSGLTTGAIIGIGVGVGLLALAGIGFLVWWWMRRSRRGRAGPGAPAYGAVGKHHKAGRSQELMAEKEEGVGVALAGGIGGRTGTGGIGGADSPQSPYSDDGRLRNESTGYLPGGSSVTTAGGAGTGAGVGVLGAGAVGAGAGHAAFHPYSDRPASPQQPISGTAASASARDQSPAPGPTAGAAASTRYAHLIEEGMTAEEIRRLEQEEQELDREIERSGRAP